MRTAKLCGLLLYQNSQGCFCRPLPSVSIRFALWRFRVGTCMCCEIPLFQHFPETILVKRRFGGKADGLGKRFDGFFVLFFSVIDPGQAVQVFRRLRFEAEGESGHFDRRNGYFRFFHEQHCGVETGGIRRTGQVIHGRELVFQSLRDPQRRFIANRLRNFRGISFVKSLEDQEGTVFVLRSLSFGKAFFDGLPIALGSGEITLEYGDSSLATDGNRITIPVHFRVFRPRRGFQSFLPRFRRGFLIVHQTITFGQVRTGQDAQQGVTFIDSDT